MIVKQVDIALDLLELFAKTRAPHTLSQISEALGLPKSSTFNLIETLTRRGFLYEVRERGGYYPTRRWLALAQDTAENDPVVERLHPILVKLQKQTTETVLLAGRTGLEIIYIDVIEATSPVRYYAKVGDRRPLHLTSGGKAILSTYHVKKRRQLLDAIEYVAYGPNTATSPEAVEEDIGRSQSRGWFENLSEFTPEVLGVGMPLILFGEAYALSVAGPNYRLLERRAEVATMLADTIAEINQATGMEMIGRAVR